MRVGCTSKDKTCPCWKPTIRRTPAEAAARYRRLRQLEADILGRRASAVNGHLEARVFLRTFRYTPAELVRAMQQGCCHWPRWFWRVVPPWETRCSV